MKIKVSSQVAGFLRRLAPVPRRKLRLALKALARGHGDIKPLEGALASYSRLLVQSYRFIIYYAGAREIECIFAEHRSIIYEIFAATLRENLVRDR